MIKIYHHLNAAHPSTNPPPYSPKYTPSNAKNIQITNFNISVSNAQKMIPTPVSSATNAPKITNTVSSISIQPVIKF
jgi:hypothetical protein